MEASFERLAAYLHKKRLSQKSHFDFLVPTLTGIFMKKDASSPTYIVVLEASCTSFGTSTTGAALLGQPPLKNGWNVRKRSGEAEVKKAGIGGNRFEAGPGLERLIGCGPSVGSNLSAE
jgi:hypothetical protein